MKTKKVTIIGLGLIGGSLAMAIKKRKSSVGVIGTSRRASTIKKALRRKIIDKGIKDFRRAVSGSDLVIICTPINRILPTLKIISRHLKKGAIVTDVGSTKAMIVKGAEKILPKHVKFVGGHPMAGKELTGLDAASANLFDGTAYILTPTKKTDRGALKSLEVFLKILKVKVLRLSPEVQDKLVAGISHLPLAVAASLVSTVAGSRDRGKFAAVASSGFRDTTRVASGSPIMGVDLFVTNRKAVLKMIGLFKKSLNGLEAKIKRGNSKAISRLLSGAKSFRDRVYKK
jgi:prephenate dehydrogenase